MTTISCRHHVRLARGAGVRAFCLLLGEPSSGVRGGVHFLDVIPASKVWAAPRPPPRHGYMGALT